MKERTKSIILFLAILMYSYFCIELVLFRWFLPSIPLSNQQFLPPEYRILAQSSKKFSVPNDYIAIFGDSYAEGLGDWLYSVDANKNPPYSAAHVIYERTGKEIISFGVGGAGSMESIVLYPYVIYNMLRNTYLFSIGDPEMILIYFYEGNDLSNNYGWKARHPELNLSKKHIEEYSIELKNEIYLPERNTPFPLMYTMTGKIKALLPRDNKAHAPGMSFTTNNTPTVAIIGNKEVNLPRSLQSPALDISENQTHEGFNVFKLALSYAKAKYQKSKLVVVYIPSPLSTYNLVSENVSIEAYPNEAIHPRKDVYNASDYIFTSVSDAARELGVDVIDSRPYLRKAAEKELVHGLIDWYHLNKRGQEALAESVIDYLNEAQKV